MSFSGAYERGAVLISDIVELTGKRESFGNQSDEENRSRERRNDVPRDHVQTMLDGEHATSNGADEENPDAMSGILSNSDHGPDLNPRRGSGDIDDWYEAGDVRSCGSVAPPRATTTVPDFDLGENPLSRLRASKKRRPTHQFELLKAGNPIPFAVFRDERKRMIDGDDPKFQHLARHPQWQLNRGGFIEATNLVMFHNEDQHFVRGYLYEPLLSLGNMIEYRQQEVCLIEDRVGENEANEQYDKTFLVAEDQLRREVCITRTNHDIGSSCANIVTNDRSIPSLICRMKRTGRYHPRDRWDADKAQDCALMFLRASDCGSSLWRIEDGAVRDNFRGPTARGGSSIGISQLERERHAEECRVDEDANRRLRGASSKGIWALELRPLDIMDDQAGSSQDDSDSAYNSSVIEDSDQDVSIAQREMPFPLDSSHQSTGVGHLRRYTFGDAFCGAGGMSRGAKEAGLSLKWGFDKQYEMCESYLENFPWVRVWEMEAHEFATKNKYDASVDVLHLSPPCKTFSPAHTISGAHDDDNEAASFAIEQLLRKCRPRVATVEQTWGMTTSKTSGVPRCRHPPVHLLRLQYPLASL